MSLNGSGADIPDGKPAKAIKRNTSPAKVKKSFAKNSDCAGSLP